VGKVVLHQIVHKHVLVEEDIQIENLDQIVVDLNTLEEDFEILVEKVDIQIENSD
jgi:hypothetical protein